MIFSYHWSYDETDDSFLAYVDDGTVKGPVLFSIDDTEEICDYISSGKMSHIDDTQGLEKYLKHLGIMQDHDSLLLRVEMKW
jgi:hypothetical protein